MYCSIFRVRNSWIAGNWYPTGHQLIVRNRKASSGWVYYLGNGVFYARIITVVRLPVPYLVLSCKYQPAFLRADFVSITGKNSNQNRVWLVNTGDITIFGCIAVSDYSARSAVGVLSV